MRIKDFVEIIIIGYREHKDYLTEYFISQAHKAKEKEYIDNEVFFQKCLEIIGIFETDIEVQYRSRINELKRWISMSTNKESIDIWRKELKAINITWMNASLYEIAEKINIIPVPQNFMGGMSWKEIQFIKTAIIQAQKNIILNKSEKHNTDNSLTKLYDLMIKKLFKEYAVDPTKADDLKVKLTKYGFFSLAAIKVLDDANKDKLIETLALNDLPYSIAMFEHLNFLKKLEDDIPTKKELHEVIAKWFNTGPRQVKGNINVLNSYSTENKNRYTAYKYKKIVINDYNQLK